MALACALEEYHRRPVGVRRNRTYVCNLSPFIKSAHCSQSCSSGANIFQVSRNDTQQQSLDEDGKEAEARVPASTYDGPRPVGYRSGSTG